MKSSLKAIAERVRGVDVLPSRQTARVSEALRQSGASILKLYGAPFWQPPDHVMAAAADALRQPTVAPSEGLLGLRRAISHKLEHLNGISANPATEVLVTNAGMHALHIVFSTLLNPGDEVVMYSPSFCFDGSIRLAGGIPAFGRCGRGASWAWDISALEAAITSRTKIIIINTPTNPTGYVATQDDLSAVAELAKRRNLYVLSDEAYENMLYGSDARHYSIAALPGMFERTISVFSFTKSYAMKEWRVGYIVAPSVLSEHLLKVLEWDVLYCNRIAQCAAQAALEGPQEWVKQIAITFAGARDTIVHSLKSALTLSFSVPSAGPFLFIDVSRLGLSGDTFSRVLLESYGVPTEPGRYFGSSHHVRLSFGASHDVLRDAANRILQAVSTCRPDRDGNDRLEP